MTTENTKAEILEIIDTTRNFNSYIGSIDQLNGKALGLVIDVAGVDGEDWTDEECLETIKEIVDMANAYRNTHPWDIPVGYVMSAKGENMQMKALIREVELEYTVNNLVRLSRKVWGENATEYLAGRIESVITYNQMKVLIDSLKGEADE